jgi:hypothetical protein
MEVQPTVVIAFPVRVKGVIFATVEVALRESGTSDLGLVRNVTGTDEYA